MAEITAREKTFQNNSQLLRIRRMKMKEDKLPNFLYYYLLLLQNELTHYYYYYIACVPGGDGG